MPALTKFYGLEPAAFDRMTVREINEYRTQLAEWQRQQQRTT